MLLGLLTQKVAVAEAAEIILMMVVMVEYLVVLVVDGEVLAQLELVLVVKYLLLIQ